jgi:hypothetical protein
LRRYVVTLPGNGQADIFIGGGKAKMDETLALLGEQGWRSCTDDICGFMIVSHSTSLGKFYHKDFAGRIMIMLYRPRFGGPRMSISGCGDIKSVTIFTGSSKWGCTLVVPVSAVVK